MAETYTSTQRKEIDEINEMKENSKVSKTMAKQTNSTVYYSKT